VANQVLKDRYELLYALFNSETKTELDKAKLSAVLGFMTHLDLNAKPRPTSKQLFDKTVGYMSGLDCWLGGQGPLEGFNGYFLRAVGLVIGLKGGDAAKAGVGVAQDVAQFDFTKRILSDEKDLNAARRQAAFADYYSPLLRERTQGFWSTARGSTPLAVAAGLSSIGRLPPLPVTDDPEPAADVSTAAVLTFDDGLEVAGNSKAVPKTGKRRPDGSLEVDLAKLTEALKKDFKALSGDVHQATDRSSLSLPECAHSNRPWSGPAGWNSSEYGAGIVNADVLLAQALPAVVPLLASASGALTTAERLAPYMPDQSNDTAAAALEALLPGPNLDRDLYAGELANHLSQNPQVRAAFSAIATSGIDDSSSTAEAEFTLGLAQLKAIASPSLAARLARQ
jgi:hypothetical protein